MTHPIVEAGARAAYLLSTERAPWDEADILLRRAYSDKAKATILAALRTMREEARIRGALHLGNSTTAHTLGLLIQGYIDALVKEIEG